MASDRCVLTVATRDKPQCAVDTSCPYHCTWDEHADVVDSIWSGEHGVTLNLVDAYRTAIRDAVAGCPISSLAHAGSRRSRYYAWKAVREELAWNLAYALAHGQTPDRGDIDGWARITEHLRTFGWRLS